MSEREIAEIQEEHRRTAAFTRIFFLVLKLVIAAAAVIYFLIYTCVIPVSDLTDYLIHQDYDYRGFYRPSYVQYCNAANKATEK